MLDIENHRLAVVFLKAINYDLRRNEAPARPSKPKANTASEAGSGTNSTADVEFWFIFVVIHLFNSY